SPVNADVNAGRVERRMLVVPLPSRLIHHAQRVLYEEAIRAVRDVLNKRCPRCRTLSCYGVHDSGVHIIVEHSRGGMVVACPVVDGDFLDMMRIGKSTVPTETECKPILALSIPVRTEVRPLQLRL